MADDARSAACRAAEHCSAGPSTLAVVRVALQFAAAAGGPSHFNPYGLNAVVAWLAFATCRRGFFRAAGGTPHRACGHVHSLDHCRHLPRRWSSSADRCLPPLPQLDALWSHAPVAARLFAIEVVWWLGAMTCVLGSVQPNSRLRLLAASAALWVALFAATRAGAARSRFSFPPTSISAAPTGGSILYAHYGSASESHNSKRSNRSYSRPKLPHWRRAPGHDRHLCHRSCRLGRPGRFRQGARWRP